MADRMAEGRENAAEPLALTISEEELGHLHSIWEAALGRAQKAERDCRNSGGRFPPEFIVLALHDDAALIEQLLQRAEQGRPDYKLPEV